jgi:hypothetical protein
LRSKKTLTPPTHVSPFSTTWLPGREAEFEKWFQHEHLQERLAVPGFLLGGGTRRSRAVMRLA